MISADLRFVVVTPERAVMDERVDFAALPMYDGELGVLPGRQPLIGRLGFGELRVDQGPKTLRWYVDGGFVQIRDDVVTVLTRKAVPEEELHPDKLKVALEEAMKPVASERQEEQLQEQLKVRAQLRLAKKKTPT